MVAPAPCSLLAQGGPQQTVLLATLVGLALLVLGLTGHMTPL